MDRQSTTPFHLKLFYRLHGFHNLTDFPIPSPARDGSANPVPGPLPPHLQIYTWQSCSLRELATLLTSCLPSLLPDPAVGTRLSFRLVYPDTKGAILAAKAAGDEGAVQGRYTSRDIGSVVIGADNRDTANGDGSSRQGGMRLQGEDADKTLQDLHFVIGDYVDCAILPPLPDGSVAPPLSGRGPAVGGGMRAFGSGPYSRDRPRGGRSGPMGRDVPMSGWRRGERLPDNGGRGGRNTGRNRGNPY